MQTGQRTKRVGLGTQPFVLKEGRNSGRDGKKEKQPKKRCFQVVVVALLTFAIVRRELVVTETRVRSSVDRVTRPRNDQVRVLQHQEKDGLDHV